MFVYLCLHQEEVGAVTVVSIAAVDDVDVDVDDDVDVIDPFS